MMSRKPHGANIISDSQDRTQMSQELASLLRHRVATRYYDQPQVIDTVARRVAADVRSDLESREEPR